MRHPVLLNAGVVTRCRHRVHLENAPGLEVPAGPPDPTAERRKADAAAHRRAVAERLAAWFGDRWAEVPPDASGEERQRMTTELLTAGVELVWGGLLPVDPASGRRGGIDLLVRVDGPAGRGPRYLPVLVVRHKVTDPGSGARTAPLPRLQPAAARDDPERKPRAQPRDQLRLAHAIRLLEASGHAAGPAAGGVIGMDADVVIWHDLDAPTWPGGRSAMNEYDARFADRLAIARSAASGSGPLAGPSRVTECRSCPWWPRCGPTLRAGRDVSMVLRGEDAVALREVGIGTVDALAALEPSAPAPAVLVGMPFSDAVVLARAWQRDLSLVRRAETVTVPRADVEVDIDMESFGDSGAYLWGCLLSGRDVGIEPGYRAFATWQPVPTEDEARSFGLFWSWVTQVRAAAAERGYSFAAYCYNEQAENRWMLSSAVRFAGLPSVPSQDEVREFIDSPGWVDLFGQVNSQFLCPHGKGLKTIAPAAGFRWRDPEAGGENSMRWYRAAVGLNGHPPDLSQRERLLRYNADDVHATRALREWMSAPAVYDIPFAGDLPALRP